MPPPRKYSSDFFTDHVSDLIVADIMQREEVPRFYMPQEVREEMPRLQAAHQMEIEALRAEIDNLKKGVQRYFYDGMRTIRRRHNMGDGPAKTERKMSGASVVNMLDQLDEATNDAFL